MVESLLAGTHGIRRRAQGGDAPVALVVRHRHRECAGRGLEFAAAAFIDRAVVEAQRELQRPAACCCSPAAARPTLAALLRRVRSASCPTSCCAASRCSRRSETGTRICYTRASRACSLTPSLASQSRVLRVDRSGLRPSEAQLPVSPKVNAPRLQLVERGPARGGGNGSCVTVGPFATNELAARARRTLGDSGYPSMPREVATRVFDGYWVYLESPPTEVGRTPIARPAARKAASPMRRPSGELGSSRRISLGVFSDETRAAAQSEKVARLGCCRRSRPARSPAPRSGSTSPSSPIRRRSRGRNSPPGTRSSNSVPARRRLQAAPAAQ